MKSHHTCGSRVRTWLGAAVLLSIAVLAPPSAAQSGAARLEIRVTDSITGEPLESVVVRSGAVALGATDARGLLRTTFREAGTQALELTRLGYRNKSILVRVGGDGATTHAAVRLDPEPIAVEALQVDGGDMRRSRALRDFYKRAETGSGRYITRAEIERKKPRAVTDLLREVRGMNVVATSLGDRPQFASDGVGYSREKNRPSTECAVRYFVDGSPYEPAYGGLIGGEIRAEEVEGIEIYRSATTVPARYRRSGPHCGTILIWKRERI